MPDPRTRRLALVLLLLPLLSCAYYNTFYNARKSYREAMELARQNPDRPTSMEGTLLREAINGAAKVLAVYPESRWVDDAQLLLGDALLQSGRRTLTGSGTSDFEEAIRAYSSAVVMTDDQKVRDRAYTGMGLAAMELRRYNDAVSSFGNVSGEDATLYSRARLLLMETLLLDHRPDEALDIARSLDIPGRDSLAAELTLLTGRAFMEAGQPDSGAALALSAAERFGRGRGFYRSLTTAAEAYIMQERPEMAVEVLGRLLAGHRSDLETAAIALLSGKARELSGDHTGALFSYRSAADLDGQREHGAEALYRRALLLESRNRMDDAIDDLEELTRRRGDHLWIRLAADRKKDLELLRDYSEELRNAVDESWLYRVMIAEKRMDLYGRDDPEAVEELVAVSRDGPDMERAMALLKLSEILPLDADSSASLAMEAYALADSGDIATRIEDEYGLPRGASYAYRPSAVLEQSLQMIEGMEFEEAWNRLDAYLGSPWSRTLRPELLWAAYMAGEGARVEDGILQGYLNELVNRYPGTKYGTAARGRLGDRGRGEDDT